VAGVARPAALRPGVVRTGEAAGDRRLSEATPSVPAVERGVSGPTSDGMGRSRGGEAGVSPIPSPSADGERRLVGGQHGPRGEPRYPGHQGAVWNGTECSKPPTGKDLRAASAGGARAQARRGRGGNQATECRCRRSTIAKARARPHQEQLDLCCMYPDEPGVDPQYTD
jgi:hypothetical protein